MENETPLMSLTTALADRELRTPHADNREAWLNRAMAQLGTIIQEKAALVVPGNVQVSVGFARHKKAIGVCIDSQGSVDLKTKHILICPTQADPVRVLDILLHELLHACLGAKVGHTKPFAMAARACGLVGKPTHTTAGEDLKAQLTKLADTLGPYQHVAVAGKAPIAKPEPGESKWVRVYSTSIEGFLCNVKREVLEEHGMPRDPLGQEMVFDKPDLGGEDE